MTGNMQEKVMAALERNGDWMTVGQVAQACGVQTNSTIRCILETMAWYGVIRCEWGWTGKQHAMHYKIKKQKGG